MCRHPLATLARLALLLACAPAALADPLQDAVRDFVTTQTQGLPGRLEIEVGGLDPRSQFGPCSSFEAFLPANARLWGKSNVGVRCLGPSTWTAYVPVRVAVFGRYLRSLRPLPAGRPIVSGDFEIVEADLTLLPGGLLDDPAQAIGKPPRVGLAAGQPLRGDQIVTPPAIRQGQQVKTISRGPGFVVSGEGKALNNAAEGQAVQVRVPSGQTISGIARPGGTVEIAN